MLESDFYTRHVKAKLGRYVSLDRVENAVSGGTPDVSFACHGVQGWVELKIVRKDHLYFSKWQLPWLTRRGPHCDWRGLWVMAMSEDAKHVFLFSARDVIAARRGFDRKWITVPVAEITQTYCCATNYVDWQGLSYVIAGLKRPIPPDGAGVL